LVVIFSFPSGTQNTFHSNGFFTLLSGCVPEGFSSLF